jgi:hypothetical protein
MIKLVRGFVAEIKQLLQVVCTMQSASSIWCIDAEERFTDNMPATRARMIRNALLMLVIFNLI